jgi:hypothetical protein
MIRKNKYKNNPHEEMKLNLEYSVMIRKNKYKNNPHEEM